MEGVIRQYKEMLQHLQDTQHFITDEEQANKTHDLIMKSHMLEAQFEDLMILYTTADVVAETYKMNRRMTIKCFDSSIARAVLKKLLESKNIDL